MCEWAQTRAGTIKLLAEDQELEEEEGGEEAKGAGGQKGGMSEENEEEKLNLVREEKLAVMLAD